MDALFRYSLFYFLINVNYAVTLAFFPLHAKFLGFTPMQIAVASAASNLATLFGAPGFTSLSHFYIAPRKLLIGCSLFASLAYFPLLFLTSFSSVLPFWMAYLILNSGSSVLVDARAVRESTEGLMRFEHARLWGSVGFMGSLALIGALIDIYGLSAIIKVGFCFSCLTHAAAYPLLFRFSNSVAEKSSEAEPKLSKAPFPRKQLTLVILTTALVWASHGAYYTYFSIYLTTLGWSGSKISLAWNLGVGAEVLVFIFFYRIREYFSLVQIIRACALVSSIRWLLLTSVTSVPLLLGIQVLHAFSFGALYLATIRKVQEILPPEFRERGQGLLSGFATGGGSLGGRLTFGVVAGLLPSALFYNQLFWIAGAFSIIACLVAFRLQDDEQPSAIRIED